MEEVDVVKDETNFKLKKYFYFIFHKFLEEWKKKKNIFFHFPQTIR